MQSNRENSTAINSSGTTSKSEQSQTPSSAPISKNTGQESLVSICDIQFTQYPELIEEMLKLRNILIAYPEQIEAIDPLWVIKKADNLYLSVQDQKLWAIKSAGIENIKVKIVPADNPGAARLLSLLNANNPVETSKKTSTPSPAKREFEGSVLRWSIKEIMKPSPENRHLEPLPKSYKVYNDGDEHHKEASLLSDATNQYYESFLPYILEETQALLKKGIEENPPTFTLRRIENSIKYPQEELTPFNVSFTLSKSHEKLSLLPQDVLYFQVNDYESSHKFIGLVVAVSKQNQAEKSVIVKMVLKENLRVPILEGYASALQFSVQKIGSLVSYERMYQACYERIELPYMEMLLTGKSLASFSSPSTRQETSAIIPALPASKISLNESQKNTIDRYLQMENGIFLTQGPPGTGKTTCITALLEILVANFQHSQERILVCAPSNKALEVLAENFLKYCSQMKGYAVLLKAEEREISPLLQSISLKNWFEFLLTDLTHLENKLWTFLPHHFLKQDNSNNNNNNAHQDLMSAVVKSWEDFKNDFIKIQQKIACFKNHFKELPAEKLNKKIELFEKNYQAFLDEISQPHVDFKNQKALQNLRNYLGNIYFVIYHLQKALIFYQRSITPKQVEAHILESAGIVFCTLEMAGSTQMLETKHFFKHIVIDEAAQALEPKLLLALQLSGSSMVEEKTKKAKAILVGDPQQLSAIIYSERSKLGRFGHSLMERLLTLNEDYPHYSLLNVQYRMHPKIHSFPSQQYYQNRVQNHLSTENRLFPLLEKVESLLPQYAFINIEGQELKGNSQTNQQEAEFIEYLLEHLVESGIELSRQVGIITFYKGQEKYMQNRFSQNPKIRSVIVNTVDSFQGSEKDIIIISFVRSNKENTVGFLENANRLNVALTRAKHTLWLVGNQKTLQSAEHIELSALMRNAVQRECVFEGEVVLEKMNKPPLTKPAVTKPEIISTPSLTQQTTPTPALPKAETTHSHYYKNDARSQRSYYQPKRPVPSSSPQSQSDEWRGEPTRNRHDFSREFSSQNSREASRRRNPRYDTKSPYSSSRVCVFFTRERCIHTHCPDIHKDANDPSAPSRLMFTHEKK